MGLIKKCSIIGGRDRYKRYGCLHRLNSEYFQFFKRCLVAIDVFATVRIEDSGQVLKQPQGIALYGQDHSSLQMMTQSISFHHGHYNLYHQHNKLFPLPRSACSSIQCCDFECILHTCKKNRNSATKHHSITCFWKESIPLKIQMPYLIVEELKNGNDKINEICPFMIGFNGYDPWTARGEPSQDMLNKPMKPLLTNGCTILQSIVPYFARDFLMVDEFKAFAYHW